ncbi:MAG: hypothetical protein ACHQ9S_18595 [Candidatus Binatia bacterium]
MKRDIACLAALLTLWAWMAYPIAHSGFLSNDALREITSALNVMHGRWFGDPTFLEETPWYPPIGSYLAAVAALLFHAPAFTIYQWESLFVNWMIPAGLFLCVRLQWGYRVAIASTLVFLFAMPWWQRGVVCTLPPYQVPIWMWTVLLLYAMYQKQRSLPWALACGAVLGLSVAMHPLFPTLLIAVFAVQPFFGRQVLSRVRESVPIVLPAAIIGGAAFFMLMRGPRLNGAAMSYFAGEQLYSATFALFNRNYLVILCGIVGVVAACRTWCVGSRMLVLFLLATLVGQLRGYAWDLRWNVPWLFVLPYYNTHQFQILFQLGWAVCAGLGIVTICEATKLVRWRLGPVVSLLGFAILCAVASYRGVQAAPGNLRAFLPIDPSQRAPMSQWIEAHTSINDVFAGDPFVLETVNVQTGRKVVILPSAFSCNPRVDLGSRARDLGTLQTTDSVGLFEQTLRARHVTYCIASRNWVPAVFAARGIPKFLDAVYSDNENGMTIYQVLPTAD